MNGWCQLWLESDSTYVVNLFTTRSMDVPWRLQNHWGYTLHLLVDFTFSISHILREGNAVHYLIYVLFAFLIFGRVLRILSLPFWVEICLYFLTFVIVSDVLLLFSVSIRCFDLRLVFVSYALLQVCLGSFFLTI